MSKLTIVLRAAVLFALVTKATVASPTDCDTGTLDSKIEASKKMVTAKNKIVDTAHKEILFLLSGVDKTILFLKNDTENAMENIRSDINQIISSASSTFNETKCRSYLTELEQKSKDYAKNVISVLVRGWNETKQRFVEAAEAAKSALRDLDRLKLRARSCFESSCCNDIQATVERTQDNYFFEFDKLPYEDQTPIDSSFNPMIDLFAHFPMWGREAIENTRACVHDTHE